MKRYLVFLILFIVLFLLPMKSYVELNNLAIVDRIDVDCSDKYILTIQEIIPVKDDNTIEYKYKKYESINTSLEKAKKEIEDSTDKKFYYQKTKRIKTNSCNKKKILELFGIK